MRIAIVTNTSWNIVNFREGLVKALLRNGVEIFAIAPEDEYSKELVKWGCTFVPIKMDNKGSNPLKDLIVLFRFFLLYRRYKIEVALQFTIKPNIYGTLAARLAGVATVNNVSGLGTVFIRNNFVSKIAKALYKIAFRFPEKIFFQNKEDLALFISEGLLSKDNAEVIPGSGVDVTKFVPSVTLSQNKEFTFLLVARLLFDKGILEYIEAIKIIKEKGYTAKFQIIGKIEPVANLGVSKDIVIQWVEDGLIDYLGVSDEVVFFYQKSDCVVLPSYREGTPRSLLEAAACGKPLIATNVPGCKEVVVEGKNGYLCKVKDAVDLSAKMIEMMKLSSEERGLMGKFSRAYICENFDENLVINAYFSTLNGILTRTDYPDGKLIL